jgi:hypothetical protein
MTPMHTLMLVLTLALQTSTAAITPNELWQSWPEERFVQTPAPCLRPADLEAELRNLAELYSEKIRDDLSIC